MAGLKRSPRPLKGRCGTCAHREICNGNTRTRAYQLTGDFWSEDPGCYLTNEEIGLGDADGGTLGSQPIIGGLRKQAPPLSARLI